MKFSKNTLIYSLVVLISLIVLILFHKIPVKQLWHEYYTLAVSKQADEKTVLSILNNAGCKSIVSQSLQSNGFFSQYSPVQKQVEESYDSKKLKIFRDKSDSYQVYYIPTEYSEAAKNAYKILIQNYHVDSYIDSHGNFPWFTPLVCLIFAVILCFFSTSKLLFATTAFFPFLFTLSQPFYADSGAICMILCGLFAFQNIFRRKNSLRVLIKNPFAITLFVVPVVLIFSVSISSAFLCVVALCGSWAMERLLYTFENLFLKSELFSFSLILPAEFVSIKTEAVKKVLVICFISLACFLTMFSSSAQFLPVNFSKDLLLPVPTRYNKESNIVSLSDYVNWNWYTITYPYRSLHSEIPLIDDVKEGDEVVIPRFTKTENGIQQTNEVVFCFDKKFVDSVLTGIDSLSDSSLEKMLKKQNNLNSVSYSSLGKSDGDYRTLFVLILELVIPVLSFILLNVRKKKNDKNSKE